MINSDDKEASRIDAIKYVRGQFDYPDKISREELELDERIVYTGREKVRKLEKEVDKSKSLFE